MHTLTETAAGIRLSVNAVALGVGNSVCEALVACVLLMTQCGDWVDS